MIAEVIDFSAERFPPPKTLEQLLEDHIALTSLHHVENLVRNEWVCKGPVEWWRAFTEHCDGKNTLEFSRYAWIRYPTGEIRREKQRDFRICTVCGRILDFPEDDDGMHPYSASTLILCVALFFVFLFYKACTQGG
jgi:hypothetical protein